MKCNPCNPLFSFHPGLLTPRQRRARGRVPFNRRVAAMIRKARGKRAPGGTGGGGESRQDLISALVNLGYKSSVAKQTARQVPAADFDSMFRSALSRLQEKNPMRKFNTFAIRYRGYVIDHDRDGWIRIYHPDGRVAITGKFKEVATAQSVVDQKKHGGTMKKNRARARKKKNTRRKNKMPAGLRKYWAKIRRRKNARRRKSVQNSRRRRVTRKARNSRRRKSMRRSNPVRMVRPPFPMTKTQLKKYARALARATGKKVVTVDPQKWTPQTARMLRGGTVGT